MYFTIFTQIIFIVDLHACRSDLSTT